LTPSQPDESSLQYRGWRVVLACFLMALFAWGFGFYGHGVFLAELQRLHGWPTAVISGASTATHLVGAVLGIFVAGVIDRVGPRALVLTGLAAMSAAALLLPFITAPWQLYGVYLLMSVGWMGLGLVAISTILGLWFTQRRGRAISLALNGASAGGVVIAPALVFLSAALGFRDAMFVATAAMLAVLLPVALFWIDRPPRPAATAEPAAPLSAWTRAMTLRSFAFRTVTAAYALALLSQAGVLVHQIAFLDPLLGRALAGTAVIVTTAMAVIGRVTLGTVIDRFDPRLATALSLVSQVAALAIMISTTSPPALLAACALYGFSVGNIITLPALIVQREFSPAAFGMVVGLLNGIAGFIGATGPGVVGLVRDLAGGYPAALIACMAMKLASAGLVMLRAPSNGRSG
jgi:MFS family permease